VLFVGSSFVGSSFAVDMISAVNKNINRGKLLLMLAKKINNFTRDVCC